eukprot:7961087-Pyramimonas_sp.AAC.1
MNLKLTLYSTPSVSNAAPSAQWPPSPSRHPMLNALPPQDELENGLLHFLSFQRCAQYSTAPLSTATPDTQQVPPPR